jgi:hypothetical protein
MQFYKEGSRVRVFQTFSDASLIGFRLSGPWRKYGNVSGEEFSMQARREEGVYPQRSVTDEQRSMH